MTREPFRQFVELLPEPAFLVETDGTIFALNAAAAKLLRSQATEITGRKFTDLVSDSEEKLTKLMRTWQFSREMLPGDLCFRRADGSIIDCRVEGGLLDGVILLRCVERPGEQDFREFADCMPQIVWTARPDGYLDYYNARWYEFTGFARGPGGDMSWEPILHAADVENCYDTWYAAVRSGKPYEIEYRFWDRSTGQYRWFLGRALPVRNGAGDIVRWFGTCTDIDHQKRLVEQLRRANEDLNQFAYSASHDLKEPLRMVAVYSQLLQRKLAQHLDAELAEYIRYTIQGAQRMETLVHDLLIYTEAATVDIDTAVEVNAHLALQKALANLRLSIEDSGAVVDTGDLPIVRAHEVHVMLLFQNLVGNAIKYRAVERPRIKVQGERHAADWLFSVADNGIGIAPQYHSQIFGVFKRLHSRTHSPGTGIGLAICKKIVERYGGRIWVDSKEGDGSTFYFTLPAGSAIENAPGPV